MKQTVLWLVGLGALLAVLYFYPLPMMWKQIRTITVVGEARDQQTNEVATFNAGVTELNDDKDAAIKNVNNKINALIASVKEFGIEEKDIKTQNMNIYQNQETYYDNGAPKQRLGQWNVSMTVEITLRDVAKASDLADLLSQSGANNVWGPNFSLDAAADAEEMLTEKAMNNAREKAEKMARNAGKKLGDVVQVVEGNSGGGVLPMYKMEGGGGGGAPSMPGSTTVVKSVTVTYELW